MISHIPNLPPVVSVCFFFSRGSDNYSHVQLYTCDQCVVFRGGDNLHAQPSTLWVRVICCQDSINPSNKPQGETNTMQEQWSQMA